METKGCEMGSEYMMKENERRNKAIRDVVQCVFRAEPFSSHGHSAF